MKRRVRGAVLYESVIVLPLVLLVLVSTIRTGILGYDQLQSDAAAMTYARYAALNIANPATQTQTLFPSTSSYTYSPIPAPSAAPAASPAIDWNQMIDGSSNMGQYNRHGGQSVIVPAAINSLVTTAGINVFTGAFGKKVNVTGSDIEPLFLECGHHWMVGQSASAGGDGTGTDCSSGQNVASYGSYFQTGENTPPYYLSQRYLLVCYNTNAAGPTGTNIRGDQDWANNSGLAPNGGWNVCGQNDDGSPDNVSQEKVWPLGSSEYLNVHNWYRPLAGWAGAATPSQISTMTTFRDLSCHQRVYAQIAASLDPNFMDYVDTNKTPAATDPAARKYSNWAMNFGQGVPANAVPFYQIVHSWDADSAAPTGAIYTVDTHQSYELNPLGQAAGSTTAEGSTISQATYCGTAITFPDGTTLTAGNW